MMGRDVLSILDNAIDFLNVANLGDIRLDNKLTMRMGGTRPRLRNPLFYLGIHELEQNPDFEFDDAEAMIPIVTLFHEVCGHGGQIVYEFDKHTSLSRVLAFNYYACKGSKEYYEGYDTSDKFTKRYASHPHEIAAQYMAIKSARTYLSSIWGLEKADDMLLKYVNHRIELDSEFITSDTPYTNVDFVLNDFDKIFKASVYKHRSYDPSNDYGRLDTDDDDSYDCFNRYIRSLINDEKNSDPKEAEKIEYKRKSAMLIGLCFDGTVQDRFMAILFKNDYKPNAAFFKRPVFMGLNLSIDHAISNLRRSTGSSRELRSEYKSSLMILTNVAEEIMKTGFDDDGGNKDLDYP